MFKKLGDFCFAFFICVARSCDRTCYNWWWGSGLCRMSACASPHSRHHTTSPHLTSPHLTSLPLPSPHRTSPHLTSLHLLGIATSFVFLRASQYYTDYNFPPVKAIAKACTTGHATNIIVGVAVGLQSCVVPILAVSFTVLSSYHLGRRSGIVPEGGVKNMEHALHNAGLFGTAVATMGMLSSAAYVLAMNNYGPIAGKLTETDSAFRNTRASLIPSFFDRTPSFSVPL